MKSASRWMSVSAFVACAWGAAFAQVQATSTAEEGAYFCPASTNAHLGKTMPIACSGDACVGGSSTTLSEPQKQFMDSEKGDCRYLTEDERKVLLPEKKPAL